MNLHDGFQLARCVVVSLELIKWSVTGWSYSRRKRRGNRS